MFQHSAAIVSAIDCRKKMQAGDEAGPDAQGGTRSASSSRRIAFAREKNQVGLPAAQGSNSSVAPRLTKRQKKAAKAAAADPRNPTLAIALVFDISINQARGVLRVLETKGAV